MHSFQGVLFPTNIINFTNMYDISTLKKKKISELQDIAKIFKIKKITS